MNNNRFIKYFGIAAAFSTVTTQPSRGETTVKKSNVLFIAVDDLRPMLGCYGDPTAVTPNIDQFASRSMVFKSAYCQIALCNPSRASLLTGLRPDTVQVWDLHAHFRQAKPETVTLPQHFKENGYHTRSIGKIFHGSGIAARDLLSWSILPVYDMVCGDAYAMVNDEDEIRYLKELTLDPSKWRGNAVECKNAPDEAYLDGAVARLACSALNDYQQTGERFFLAVGFRKPHLPFVAPKKYWDMYDREKIPLPDRRYPVGAPELAIRHWQELQNYGGVANETDVPVETMKELRHAYYACVSFIDAQVGRVLAELDRLELSQNTIVILWGDHGFHLGEQNLWTKGKNYEWTTHVPLILSVPGVTDQGETTDAFVEFVDIYPTLSELCSLPLPEELEGTSMIPLLYNPSLEWKKAAFSQFSRDLDQTVHRHKGRGDTVGRAIRTRRYRYVEWRGWDSGKLLTAELYDHQTDSGEMTNVVNNLDYAKTVNEMSRILQDGWQAALPPCQNKK